MIDDLTPAERDAVRALRDSRGPCPPAEALVAYEALGDSERATRPEHTHVQVCSRCQLVLLHMQEPGVTRSGWIAWALPLAAVLVLAVGVSLLTRTERTVPPETGTIRGMEIQTIAPAGTIDVVPEFSWQSPLQVDRYRIVLYAGSSVVWQAETKDTRIRPPNDVVRLGEQRWVVEGLDREGNVRITSPPQSFTYSPRVP